MNPMRSPALLAMPGVAVGQRHKLYLVAERCVLSGESPRAEVTVIRVCAKGNDAHRLILRERRQRSECQRREKAHERHRTRECCYVLLALV